MTVPSLPAPSDRVRRSEDRFLFAAALAVLAAYFAVIATIQPAGRLVPPSYEGRDYFLRGGLARVVYDDADVAAWVLRAENAKRGRKAGAANEPPPVFDAAEFDAAVADDPPPTPRYFLEYPAAALYFFRLGLVGAGGPPPAEPVTAGLLDANQFDTLNHAPRGNTEIRLYRSWRHAQRVYAAVLLSALAVVMALTARGVGANGRAAGPAWLLVLPAMLYFTPCRYDILPAALVLFSFAATDRGWLRTGALLLGCAVAVKMYPLVIAPMVLRYAARSWRGAVLWCGYFALPVLLGYGSIMLTDGPAAAVEPLRFQLNRPAEPDWVLDGRFWPKAWLDKDTKTTRQVILLFGVLALAATRPPGVESLLRRAAVAVTAFVCLQFFFSPQWWQWVAVLLVPLTRTHLWLKWLVVAADLAVFAMFPLAFELTDSGDMPLRNGVVYARGITWGAVCAAFLAIEVREWRRGRGASREL